MEHARGRPGPRRLALPDLQPVPDPRAQGPQARLRRQQPRAPSTNVGSRSEERPNVWTNARASTRGVPRIAQLAPAPGGHGGCSARPRRYGGRGMQGPIDATDATAGNPGAPAPGQPWIYALHGDLLGRPPEP